jgi:hypothetical protein
VTVKKSLKRRVRARMSKTGERYAAARRPLIAKPTPSPETAAPSPAPDPASAPTFAAPLGMSDDAVRRRTGKTWDEWFSILDSWGAADRTHTAASVAKGAARYSRVTFGFLAKGDTKSQVAIQHSRLRDAGVATGLKTFWRDRLAALQKLLEAGT